MRNVTPTLKVVTCTGVDVQGDTTQVNYKSDKTPRVAWMTHVKGTTGWFATGQSSPDADPDQLGGELKKSEAVSLCSRYCADQL